MAALASWWEVLTCDLGQETGWEKEMSDQRAELPTARKSKKMMTESDTGRTCDRETLIRSSAPLF